MVSKFVRFSIVLFKHIVYSNIQNGRHVASATTVRSSVTEPRDWAAVQGNGK